MAWAYEVGRLVERQQQEAQPPASSPAAAAAAVPPAGDAAVTSRQGQGQGHGGEEKETRRMHTYGKVRDTAMDGRGGCRYQFDASDECPCLVSVCICSWTWSDPRDTLTRAVQRQAWAHYPPEDFEAVFYPPPSCVLTSWASSLARRFSIRWGGGTRDKK